MTYERRGTDRERVHAPVPRQHKGHTAFRSGIDAAGVKKALQGKAEALYGLSRFDEAVPFYRSFLETASDEAAWNNLGLCLLEKGLTDEAETCIKVIYFSMAMPATRAHTQYELYCPKCRTYTNHQNEDD